MNEKEFYNGLFPRASEDNTTMIVANPDEVIHRNK